MSEIEEQTENKYQEFVNERIETNKISSDREQADAEKINKLVEEIQNMRFKIRELEATNKEVEYVEL
jgi:predicted ribosome quality control (RQC) complex YloA/Tae2 family protein